MLTPIEIRCGPISNGVLIDSTILLATTSTSATPEIIAAHARDGIHFTNALQQSGRHEFQQLIADIVPQRIIDGFESIQVEQHDRQGVIFPFAARHGMD